jgi:acetylornithine deacetylase
MPTIHDALDGPVVLDVLERLISVPSVNPSIAPDEAHGEVEIARTVCDWLAQRGVRAWTEEAAPGRPNVVAEVGAHGIAPTLVFCAHLDTVGTSGMTIPPFAPRCESGRVYGRGSYDMKGSAAAIMCALEALRSRELRGRVMAALVADEEYASIGAADFVRRHPVDACIVTEPSEGQLILAHKGFVWAEVRTTGQAAHGSRWDLGVSAIAKMAPIIAALDAFDRTVLRKREHPLVGPASLHCALVKGGVGLSTYAPECQLTIERRTIPGETTAAVEEELTRLIGQVDESARVKCFFDRPPLACDREARVVGCVRDAVTMVTGQVPIEAGVGYWMDAAIFAAAGVPTVNYGPSGAGAHEAVEWVDLQSVVDCARVLVESAERFFLNPEPVEPISQPAI